MAIEDDVLAELRSIKGDLFAQFKQGHKIGPRRFHELLAQTFKGTRFTVGDVSFMDHSVKVILKTQLNEEFSLEIGWTLNNLTVYRGGES